MRLNETWAAHSSVGVVRRLRIVFAQVTSISCKELIPPETVKAASKATCEREKRGVTRTFLLASALVFALSGAALAQAGGGGGAGGGGAAGGQGAAAGAGAASGAGTTSGSNATTDRSGSGSSSTR